MLATLATALYNITQTHLFCFGSFGGFFSVPWGGKNTFISKTLTSQLNGKRNKRGERDEIITKQMKSTCFTRCVNKLLDFNQIVGITTMNSSTYP